MKKSKIKILFIAKDIYRLFNPNWPKVNEAIYGGVEVDIYKLALELAKDKKFEVIVLTKDLGQPKKEKINNVQLINEFSPKDKKPARIFKLIKTLIKENPDIFFLEKAHGLNGVVRIISKIINKKMIFRTSSDIDCNKKALAENIFERALYRYSLKNSDLVITQNEKNKEDLIKYHNVKSIIIKNIINIPKFYNRNKNLVLWAGRSEELKRPFLFLKLAKELLEYKFLMICSKAYAKSVNLQTLLENSKKIKNLKIILDIDYKQINKFFKKAKIFINTSDYEGFPNTFVEAAASSTPIISLNVNPDNFLDKHKCGFCANGNLELMKKQIKNLLENKKLYNSMSKNSYNYAKKNHDVREIIPQYKKIIKKLVNKK